MQFRLFQKVCSCVWFSFNVIILLRFIFVKSIFFHKFEIFSVFSRWDSLLVHHRPYHHDGFCWDWLMAFSKSQIKIAISWFFRFHWFKMFIAVAFRDNVHDLLKTLSLPIYFFGMQFHLKLNCFLEFSLCGCVYTERVAKWYNLWLKWCSCMVHLVHSSANCKNTHHVIQFIFDENETIFFRFLKHQTRKFSFSTQLTVK